ncbi:hypothetical protein NDU88_003190 [Pleurodeles waltl]|uniref:Uncharacterized protein n=1 Tax=Pleurodeles waltl TaxID=8319 RepID=A0AAV7REZ3_PLEWA|nr:hypothetical protein NDU88_003190 [Pleurodeles waltl]
MAPGHPCSFRPRLGRFAPWSLPVFRLRPFPLLLLSSHSTPSPDSSMLGYLSVPFPAVLPEGRPDWRVG